MSLRVLYLGDSTLATAAAYLAGVMHRCDIAFEHHSSSFAMTDEVLQGRYDVFVLSDYPARCFTPRQLQWLCRSVVNGAGLVMIGGWASFTGLSGRYGDTALADVLPVRLSLRDDRFNTWTPCVVSPGEPHPITRHLPFERNLPCVSGFNVLTLRESACEVLRVNCFEADVDDAGLVSFSAVAQYPLLVVGQYGKGRTVCLATDAAPHWCGGLVDWGEERIEATAPGAREVSMGSGYAKLFENMLRFAAGRL